MIDFRDLRIVWGQDGKPISGEVTFTHVDDETQEVRIFAVERIAKYVEQYGAKRVEVPIDPAFAAFLPRHKGIEKHRLARITVEDLISYPLLLAHMPGIARGHDEHLIVDGTHRYFFAYAMGWKSLPGFEVPKEVWSKYLVYLPPELMEFQREEIRKQCQDGIPINSGIR